MFPATLELPAIESDGDLERRVTAYLASRSFLSFRRLKVTADGGTVTITGDVSSFHEKQVASESCRRVAGVLRIVDAIRVLSASTLNPASLAAIA